MDAAICSFLLLMSLCFSTIRADVSKEVVVLDTMATDSVRNWQTYPQDGPSTATQPTWTSTSWQSPLTGGVYVGFTVCSVATERVDNWLRTDFIRANGVSHLYVNISFFMRQCKEYPIENGHLHQCGTSFQVLKHESNMDYATNTTPTFTDSAYTLVKTVPADYTYISDNDPDIKANNASFSMSKSRNGFYLALREFGTCAFILSIKVYYKRCPATVIRHTQLPEIPASNVIETAYGTCVENAVPADPAEKLEFLCTNEGNWFNPTNSRGCVCKQGYHNTANGCAACPAGKYKSTAANSECLPCPDHSQSLEPGQARCKCDNGYYRGVDESPDTACAQAPGPVTNLDFKDLTADSVTLTWKPPSFLGGRTDLFYTTLCEACSQTVLYNPSKRGNAEQTVTLTKLVPDTEYTVVIMSENGASSSAPINRPAAEITFVTSKNRVIKQDTPVKSEGTPTSLVITWNEVPNAAWYKVFYSLLNDKKRRSESTVKVTTNQVTLSSLEPATAYNVQVEYYDENDVLIDRSAEQVFETEKKDNSSLVIGIAITAVLVCMAIVITIVVLFLRSSKQPCSDKPHSDCEGLGPYTNVPFHITANSGTPSNNNITLPLFNGQTSRCKTYVDPHTYEDPRQAVKEFTKEIDVSCITIEAVIGGGEFGDVCRGKLKLPNKDDMCVAIKTLKPGASEKNRLDFLTEASIMGQFEDPNVIFLEGVITKSNPIMIVTEYMENGSLDTFLRANDGKLAVVQLLGMLRGISSGMTYLSEMSYIHRDLAARNILVNNDLMCKVADFGLSREVEYDTSEGAYTTRGGKIPVRWTAPEAIAYRKFTSASDVWSFGVVMWEVMSCGERPYWNWSNQDVIKAVDRGYRLPPPMECPEAVHQLMLDCWQKDRKNRPKFAAVRNTLDRLMQSPDLLRKMAKPVVPAMFDPEMPDITSNMTVSEWLQAIKMDRYTESFAQKGIHSMDQVAWLTFADLLDMGVTLVGHQKKIMSSVQALRCRLDGSASPVQMSEGFLV